MALARKDFNENNSNPNKIRYYFAAQRFYGLMFEETNDEIYKELFDITYSVYNQLLPTEKGFDMYSKA